MPDVQTLDTSDSAVVPGGSHRDIHFRPGLPGPISARTVAANPPAHSESGLLGKLFFRRPGHPAPLATSTTKLGQTAMALDYSATAADLTTPGDWICQVVNETESDISFQTDVTYPGTIQLIPRTATIDIPFLNILLTNAARAAEVRVHVQSSPAEPTVNESLLSWSSTLPLKVNGLSEFPFHIDDPGGVYRIVNLNSKPAGLGFQPGALVIELALDFDVTTGKIIDLTSVLPGIELDLFDIVIQLDFAGNITPICNTKAILRVNSIDISGIVQSQVLNDINARIQGNPNLTPQAIVGRLTSFFGLFLRLGPADRITSFGMDGNNLVINYLTPASVAVPPGGVQTGNVAAGAA